MSNGIQNVVELSKKVILNGIITKESCSTVQTQNETLNPREDLLKRLVWLIMDIKEDIFVQLEHNDLNIEIFYIDPKNIKDFVYGNEWLNISIL